MASLPNYPAPIRQEWIDRGLTFLSLGNGLFWTKDRGWTGAALHNGGPKKPAGKFGQSTGFGTTYGTGTSDRVDGPAFTTSVGFRSVVAFCYAQGFGGNGSGRIFQAAGTTGVVAQDESMFVSNASTREMTYTHIATSTVGQWFIQGSGTGIELNAWNCYSLTHDCRTSGNTPVGYKNGRSATVGVVSASTGSYVRTTAVMNIGNRSTDNARGFDGMHGPLMLFDHPDSGLTAQEHSILARDPSALFQPLRRSYFFGPPAATGYTLIANAGSYTDTGFDAVLLTAGKVDADAGSYAYTGADATLTYAPATFVIDDNYERSSIDVAGSSVVGSGDSAVVSLKPRQVENETAGTRWLEPSARVTGVNGFTPKFRFLDYASGEMHGYPFDASNRMSFSYDFETWHYFDNATRVAGSYIEFWDDDPFSGNSIFVTRGRQVTVTQWGQFCEDIATTYSSFAGPTASAIAFTPTLTSWPGQSLIAGEFSPQTDELGRTVPATPFYAMRINDTSMMPANGVKKIMMFTTGIHAGEDLAEIALMEAINEACGSSAAALTFRREIDARIYGLINAPGRYGGSWRSGFTQGAGGADDAARHFPPQSDAGLETVLIPKAAMLLDLGSDVPYAVIDMHGTYINNWSTFKDTGNAAESTFHSRLASNSGFTVVDEGDSTNGTIGYWAANVLGVTGIALTVEHGDPTPQSDANYVTWGAAIIKSLADAFHQLDADPGSYSDTGQAAALRLARKLAAEQGAYALTGSDATLTYEPIPPPATLVAAVGSYAGAGQSAGLVVARKLASDQGMYAGTGSDSRLAVARLLQAAMAGYTYTGYAALLSAPATGPSESSISSSVPINDETNTVMLLDSTNAVSI
jgi:hypothetical protein